MPTFDAIEVSQKNHSFLLTRMPAMVLVQISYAAVRGASSEDGAVQRALNPQRISSLREFALRGGDYPVTVVLNWTNPSALSFGAGKIDFEILSNCAQIIDGQHRIAGLSAAIDANEEIGLLDIPVAIYVGLNTQQCADIFLAINTEQRPAPKSLVYDLFGIAHKASVNVSSMRARDISLFINEVDGSPYFRDIKLPGEKVRKGGVALSTAVAAIKPLVEQNGHLERVGLRELEPQQTVVLNFIHALSAAYGLKWDSKENAFKYASGFTAAMQFLADRVIPYCRDKKSFKSETMGDLLQFGGLGLVYQSELKGLAGSQAVKEVFERLDASIRLPDVGPNAYEF